jgi:hypothetical protein
MGATRRVYRAACWALLGAALALAAQAQDSPLWQKARSKMTGSTGYSMRYDYEGPEGLYKFHYVVQGDGSKILTEVLEGSARGEGSRILYDLAADKDNVTMQTHMLTLRRSLQARDIADSSLYQPLFRQLVEDLVEPEPRESLKAGDHTVLIFGDKGKTQDRLELDKEGNPVAMRRLEKGREVKRMAFHDLTWGPASIPWP